MDEGNRGLDDWTITPVEMKRKFVFTSTIPVGVDSSGDLLTEELLQDVARAMENKMRIIQDELIMRAFRIPCSYVHPCYTGSDGAVGSEIIPQATRSVLLDRDGKAIKAID